MHNSYFDPFFVLMNFCLIPVVIISTVFIDFLEVLFLFLCEHELLFFGFLKSIPSTSSLVVLFLRGTIFFAVIWTS